MDYNVLVYINIMYIHLLIHYSCLSWIYNSDKVIIHIQFRLTDITGILLKPS